MRYIIALCFLLLFFYFSDKDGFTAALFGKENKSYFVNENSGWPYKSYKKEPGYEYFIKDNKVCKKRSSNIEQNQVEEENVGNENTSGLESCYMCSGEGIRSECGTCLNSGNAHCRSCRGYGNVDGRTCRNCGGSGLIICSDCGGNPSQFECSICRGSGYTKQVIVECSTCEGARNKDVKDCYFCQGSGSVYKTVSSKD
jgi:hypothetical protein